MESPYRTAISLLEPYVVESEGVNLFLYPGTKEEFVDGLENMGVDQCIPKFALRFKGQAIDMDLLFFIVDVLKTTDGGVIFYSPDSNRIPELKMIRRPAGGLDSLLKGDMQGPWQPPG
jgi:hypothetical protein